MTEIREQIERLRDAVELTDREFMAEAADTIERLLAENERQANAKMDLGRENIELKARLEKLEAVLEAAEEVQKWVHPDSPGWVEEDLEKAIAEAEK